MSAHPERPLPPGPWALRRPLQDAEADISVNTMAAAHGILLPETTPLLHFARRLDMRCWPIRRV